MRYEFANCALETQAHSLTRDGAEVHVEPQVFDLIACLVRARGALVTYDDLMAEVWNNRIVSDSAMAARISAARSALGDSGKRQAVIRTIPRRGLQIAVPVAVSAPPAPPASQPGPAAPSTLRQTIRYTTSRDGTGVAWAETGAGPPVLRGGHWLSHLEHDWTSVVWRPLLERLSRGRRLLRYDPRGTGLSDRQMNGATVEQLADDMEAVADAAGLERFPIYATSQSVPAALTLAARRPERISRLLLLNGVVQGSTARGEAEKTETMVGMIRSGWGIPGSPFMRAVATVFMPLATPEEVQSLVDIQVVSATPEVAAELRRIIGDIDVRACLDKVECPVLVMHFSGDQIQSPDQSRYLARALKDAEFHMWDSPNHVVVPSDPIWSDLMDTFDRFLDADLSVAGNAGGAR